ncbi:hypothetical protein [Pseudoxanthomonas koreensis]|uniref:hypothetical protein n=1 Tax=Pseudoxanthomonas koreensis TaxID=266061 RepID=UPI0035A5B4E7
MSLVFAAVAMPQAKAEEVGKYVYAYDADTYRVLTLRYGPQDGNQMLVKISGIDNDQDGRIYLHTKKCDTSKCDAYKWVTTEVHKPDGHQWFTIYNPGGWSSGDILQPYLVEPSASGKVYLREKVQTNLDPEFFLANYKRQQGKK